MPRLAQNSTMPHAGNSDSKLVIKHTFLDLVSMDQTDSFTFARSRFFSDTALDYVSTCDSNSSDSGEQDLLSSFNSVESIACLASSTSPGSLPSSLNNSMVSSNSPVESQAPACPVASLSSMPTTQSSSQTNLVQMPQCGVTLGWMPITPAMQPSCSPDVMQSLLQPIANDGLVNDFAQGLRSAELELKAAQLRVAALQAELAAHDMLTSGRAGISSMKPPQAFDTCANNKYSQSNITDSSNSQEDLPQTSGESESRMTTVMMRHVPKHFTRTLLLGLLDAEGFQGCYDFVYMPVDFSKRRSFGYAFINMVSNEEALRLRQAFDGYVYPMPEFACVGQNERSEDGDFAQQNCEISWGHPLQGLAAHIERYRNSPVMHKDVPEEFKPVLLQGGQQVKFPPPTKRIRAPRLKRASPTDLAMNLPEAELTVEE